MVLICVGAKLARSIVETRLAACVNIIPGEKARWTLPGIESGELHRFDPRVLVWEKNESSAT